MINLARALRASCSVCPNTTTCVALMHINNVFINQS
jgi:hypothetical protein